MSKLEQLIKELCPNGVPFYSLAEMGTPLSGMSAVTGKWKEEGNCRFIDYMNVYKHIQVDVSDLPYATVKNIDKQIALQKGDILFTAASETPDECALSAVIADDLPKGILLDDHLFGLRINDRFENKVITGYLKYIFRSEYFRNIVQKTVRGVTRHYIAKPAFLGLQIPLPPLAVQREIVHILDRFTLLSAELAAELAARCKQYEFYRDKLLSFDKLNGGGCEVRWLNLEDVVLAINTGLNPRQFFMLNTEDATNFYVTIREIRNHQIVFSEKTDRINDEALGLCNRRANIEKGDVLFSGTGTIGETALVTETPKNWSIKEGVYNIKPDSTIINSKFLMYLFDSTSIREKYMKKAAGGTVQSVPMAAMKKLQIPVPPIEVQERIVNVLDNFDKICSDLGIGLPAEIEKRRQQYEYYRDKLLTFN